MFTCGYIFLTVWGEISSTSTSKARAIATARKSSSLRSSVIATEIGLLTPPLGLAVYVVHSTLGRADISLKEIFLGAAPFALAMLFALILIIAYPPLSTFLVQAVK